MLLALPIQGFAATTMLLCDHTGHHSAVTKHDNHHTSHAHEHHQHKHDDSKSLDKFSKNSESKCSACSACCFGGAITNSMPKLSVSPVAPEQISFIHTSFLDFTADGFERPPYRILI